MIVLICLLIYETPVSSEHVSCLHLFALSPEPRVLCPLWRGAGGLEARCPPSSPRIPPGQQTARAGVCPTSTTGELSLSTGGAACRTGCLAEAFPHNVRCHFSIYLPALGTKISSRFWSLSHQLLLYTHGHTRSSGPPNRAGFLSALIPHVCHWQLLREAWERQVDLEGWGDVKPNFI